MVFLYIRVFFYRSMCRIFKEFLSSKKATASLAGLQMVNSNDFIPNGNSSCPLFILLPDYTSGTYIYTGPAAYAYPLHWYNKGLSIAFLHRERPGTHNLLANVYAKKTAYAAIRGRPQINTMGLCQIINYLGLRSQLKQFFKGGGPGIGDKIALGLHLQAVFYLENARSHCVGFAGLPGDFNYT